MIWLFFGIVVGVTSALTAGKLSDRIITVLALIGISMPVFWLGLVPATTWPRAGSRPSSRTAVRAAHAEPGPWLYHLILPWLVLAVLFIGFYGRVLRSNILDTVRRGLRAHGQGQGADAAADPAQARAAHVADPDRDAVGARLRVGARRRRDPRRRRCSTCTGVGEYAAQSIGALDLPPVLGVDDVRRILHRRASASSSIVLLRVPRPADQADLDGRERLLDGRAISVCSFRDGGAASCRAVDGVSFSCRGARCSAIVGESGSGKSVTAMTLMGLTRGANSIFEGGVHCEGQGPAQRLARRECQDSAAREIAMIFQDPMTSLDPVLPDRRPDRRGDPGARRGRRSAGARDRAVELLSRVGIPTPDARVERLPAPVLRRHAPARDDRDGAVVRPDAADRRRADDGARRDHPGADPRADLRACSDDVDSAVILDHPRPRRRRRDRRPRRRHVRRPGRRAAARVDELFYDPQHPVHVGPARLDPARSTRPRHERLPPIEGAPPSLISPPAGLRIRAALPAGVRAVHAASRRSRAASRMRRAPATAAGSTSSASGAALATRRLSGRAASAA